MLKLRALKIFMTITLASQGLAPLAYGGDLEEQSAKKYFLMDLKDRVTAAIDMNKVFVDHVAKCLSKMSDAEFSASLIVGDRPLNTKESCADAVAQVRQNTRIKYPIVRRTLLLSEIVDGSNIPMLLSNLQHNIYLKGENKPPVGLQVKNSASFTSAIVVENPIEASLSEDKIPAPEWTREELAAILTSPDGTTRDGARDGFNSVFKHACASLEKRTGLNFNVCKDSRLVLSPTQPELQMIYEGGDTNSHELVRQVELLKSFLGDAIRGDSKRWNQEFQAMIQLNPYVGLVTSASANRQDFIQAFTIVSERAQRTVVDFSQLRAEKKLDDEGAADPEVLLSLMRYTPLARQLIDKPGPRLAKVMKLMPLMSVESVFNDLVSDFEWQELKRVGANISKAIGLNMLACWIPVSWAGKTAGRFAMQLTKIEKLSALFKLGRLEQVTAKTLTPICFTAGGILINIGFLYESVHDYQTIYAQVFGSVGEETLVREVNGLGDKEREIFWSIVMFPMGTGAVSGLKKLFSNIPERIWSKAVTHAPAGAL